MTAINLLIVEDSADDAELMVRALRRAGVDPTYERVETPEAMEAALARGSWDLVISDYSMPHFSGLAALKLLQDKELDLPFILVSGNAGENVAVDAMKAGAHHYILKDNLARLAPAVERELRDAELRRERQRAESRYRNLFNSVPVGVFITTPEGKVIEANPRFVAMLGFADEESLKRVNVGELWNRPEERAQLNALLARDGVVENREVEFRRPDGTIVWCVVSAHVVRDAAGKIDHYEEVSVDITERKRAEQELSRARDAALEGMRIKSEFMSNMSHEIRTPLNGVIGMNELLLDSGLNAEQLECAKTAAECGRLLMTIVNRHPRLLQVDRGQGGFRTNRFRLVRSSRKYDRVVRRKGPQQGSRARPGAGSRRALNHYGRPQPAPAGIEQSDRKRFEIHRWRRGRGKRDRERANPRQGDNSIRDPRHRDRYPESPAGPAFQPFLAGRRVNHAQVRRDRSGPDDLGETGRRHGGEDRYRKRVGRGFDILFDRGLPTAAAAQQIPRISPLAGLSALVVDDNATNRAALVDTMRSWGMIADAVHGGDEALAALRLRSAGTQPFDVILVDAQMPSMDGATLARTIGLDPDLAKTSLIMMGAAKKAEGSMVRERDGSDHWLNKPIKPSHLHATLCALLASEPLTLQGPHDKVELAARPAAAVPSNGKSPDPIRILVVDDNLVNRKVARKQLERLGYLVDVVDGGKPALAAMANAPYPVVLLDCEMPEMDGYATTVEIRRRENGERHTTIIAMTGHALEGARERCLDSGMDEYVAKPVTLDALAAVLDVALRQ